MHMALRVSDTAIDGAHLSIVELNTLRLTSEILK